MKRTATPSEHLEVIVPVRFTRGERDQLDLTARDFGLRLSPFIRRTVLDRPLPPRRHHRPVPEINRLTYVELNRIGGNLNQLVRNLHVVGGPAVTAEKYRRELLQLGEVLVRMQRQLAALEQPGPPSEEAEP